MPDISGSGGTSPTNGGKDLLVSEGSLTSFKKQLDKLVAELKRTPAAPEEIHASAVPTAAYGDFPGARDLATHLARVQTRLELFAKIYGEQIEALGVAAQVSARGYADVEDETRQRMRAIQQNLDRYHSELEAVKTESPSARPTSSSDRAGY
ncbi:hypothetical protein GL263_15615 [Streptomyces durbertensis]|uniref:PE domain-containing protein n=1 Tax=Streptomyces durbertensis TaxID=2448886 RepID=A0ABR6EI16_9ACTN|nr:hypothetical protein [Streptomyces durbertensis]MBB1244984.1 hypothetical protein [Streptomyces durbertensis]